MSIDLATKNSIEAIRDHDTQHSVYFIGSGAGAGLQSLLWSVPGCSRFLAGAEFPYAQDKTQCMLGFAPNKYASDWTAIDMAINAYLKAIPSKGYARPVGIGLTASVASGEVHGGTHRVHIAVMTQDGCRLSTIFLKKNCGDLARVRDGRVADLLALHSLFKAVGVGALGDNDAAVVFDSGHDVIKLDEAADDFALEQLLAHPIILADCRRQPVSALNYQRTMIHACTANPPHAGHIDGALAALDAHHCDTGLTTRLIHSLTLDPPNKPVVTVPEALRRARLLGFMGRDMLVSTGDPLYVQKAERYPGAAFVLGADAVLKLLDPQWGVDPYAVLSTFNMLGTVLYVVGRTVPMNPHNDKDVEFVTLHHPRIKMLIPERFLKLFRHVPGRWDVSSTELRAGAQ